MNRPSSISKLLADGDRMAAILVDWANQNSGSDNSAGLESMFALLNRAFSRFGEVERIPTTNQRGTGILRVAFNPDAPHRILFSGHYDTVYGANHAFQRCQNPADLRLNGPGVADMKGGLVVMLAALEALQDSDSWPLIGGEILITPDEETGSEGSRGTLELAAKRNHCALVFEPARENGDLVRARMGVGALTISCRGISAHAGKAKVEGRNAVIALSQWLTTVDRLTRQLPDVVINVARIEGGGAINVVPDFARVEINIRAGSLSAADGLLTLLRKTAEAVAKETGVEFVTEGDFERPPKEVFEQDESLFASWQQCGTELDLKFGWQDVAGGSDGNILRAQNLPTLDGLGPIGGNLHSDNEYIVLSSLAERAAVSALFLHRIAVGDLPMPR